MTIALWIIAVILIIIGVAGIVLPALPGTLLIVGGILLAAWADDFARVGMWPLIAVGVIGVLTYGVDLLAAALGAKTLGASSRAMVGAGLGTVAGLFLGLPGIIIGPFVGAVIGELTVDRDIRKAGKAGVAAWIGFAIGTAVKVSMAFLMIGIFLLALFVLVRLPSAALGPGKPDTTKALYAPLDLSACSRRRTHDHRGVTDRGTRTLLDARGHHRTCRAVGGDLGA